MTWTSVTTLSRRLDIGEKYIRQWCAEGLVVAEKLPRRYGQWRIAVNDRGFPLKTAKGVAAEEKRSSAA